MPPSICPHRYLPLTYISGFWSLIILLVLSNGPAYAEWVEVGAVENGMTVYTDLDTIRRKGDLVKMWVLFDHNLVQRVDGTSFMYLSNRSQHQFDCAEERFRWLASAYISGNMEKGEVVFSNAVEGKWAPVHPRSVAHALWKVACGKK